MLYQFNKEIEFRVGVKGDRNGNESHREDGVHEKEV